MVHYKLLGNSGLKVSEICLGTMSFGTQWGFGADPEESRKIIETFAEAGGNFLDTANKYHDGQSEEIVGAVVAEDRHRWVIASKYTLATRPGDPNGSGNSRKNMRRAVEESLRRLGTDYLDLLWVHAWDFTTPTEEVMRGLDDLVSAGKVTYVGVSDAPAWVVARAQTLAELRGWAPFIGLQVPYSVVERDIERELLPMAEALEIGVTAWAPLAAGVLTGKYTRGGDVDAKRTPSDRRLSEESLAVARRVDAIADGCGATSAQVAVAWVRQQSEMLIPIVGARKVQQMTDVLGSVDLTLSDEDLAALDEASAIDLGFPQRFYQGEVTRAVIYGDTAPRLQMPRRTRR